MKLKSLALASLALITAAAASAATPSPSPGASSKGSKTTANAGDQTQQIDSYVREIEGKTSSYTRKEEMLAADKLKKVTDENWSKIHTYSEGKALKRMKLYPAAGSQKTEEFYYKNDKPVFVFLEANGAGKENHDANAKGEKYYFANGKLVAAMSADGSAMDINSADAKKTAAKLMKEAQAFRAAAK